MTWSDIAAELDELLRDADAAFPLAYPGERLDRQPVHTLYVPADKYDGHTLATYGAEAEELLDASAVALNADKDLVERVRHKLAVEPIEDLRVDFEDGYGFRSDDIEDADVDRVAGLLNSVVEVRPKGASEPAFWGIRFKSFDPATRERGLRTLSLLLARGATPTWVTLPKVTSVDQVVAMVVACERLEEKYEHPLRFEIQVETPQAIMSADGVASIARMIHVGAGRVTGLHYGTYDYSASVGVAAAYQSMEHPAADHAKSVLQVAAAGTGVFLSDGSTNVLPIGDDRDDAWRLHARLVRRSLERGFYQGWDLHPAQLPSRYLATYAFYRDGMKAAVDRLVRYREGAASGILDEPATERALVRFLQRGVDCGAIDADEIGIAL